MGLYWPWARRRRKHTLGRTGLWEIIIIHEMPIVGPLRHELGEGDVASIQWTAGKSGGYANVVLRPARESIPVLRELVTPRRDHLVLERDGEVVFSARLRTISYESLSRTVTLTADADRDAEEAMAVVPR